MAMKDIALLSASFTQQANREENANQSPESFRNMTMKAFGFSGIEKKLIFITSPHGVSTPILHLLKFVDIAHFVLKAPSIESMITFAMSATESASQVADHLENTYIGSVGFRGAVTFCGNRLQHLLTGVSTLTSLANFSAISCGRF